VVQNAEEERVPTPEIQEIFHRARMAEFNVLVDECMGLDEAMRLSIEVAVEKVYLSAYNSGWDAGYDHGIDAAS
jgi:hypothetical protein